MSDTKTTRRDPVTVADAVTRKQVRFDGSEETAERKAARRSPPERLARKSTKRLDREAKTAATSGDEPCVRANQILFASAPGGGLRVVFF